MKRSDEAQAETVTSASTGSRIVKLNVGGRLFMTTERTLLSCSSCETFFTALLRGGFARTEDDDRAIFIDRDGTNFDVILSFLRTGLFTLPPGRSLDAVYAEADFYGLLPLCELITARLGGGPLFLARLCPTTERGSMSASTSSLPGTRRLSRTDSGGSSSSSSWRPVLASADEPLRVLSLCAASNVVAARHQGACISVWRYEGVADGWRPLMRYKALPFAAAAAASGGLILRETKNSIESVKNTVMCAWAESGTVQLWDRLHDATSHYREWAPMSLSVALHERVRVRFLVNTRFLVGLSRDGRECRIADLRSPHVPAEAVTVLQPSTPARVTVTCTADADPFLFLGCSDGTVHELKQDISTGAWVCDRVFSDPLGDSIESLHCAAIADRQSAKLFLCIGTGSGTVRLCSKTVHSDVSFALLATVSGHHSEPIVQVLVSESFDTGGLLFSSLSSGGYLRSWHLPLELPPARTSSQGDDKERSLVPSHVPLHVLPPQPQQPGGRDAVGAAASAVAAETPQQRLAATATAQGPRCICTIAHVSGAATPNDRAGSTVFSELVSIGRSSVQQQPGFRKNSGQLLVAAHLNNSVSTYDIGAISAAAPGAVVKTVVHPVDGSPATACCVVAATSPAADSMLVTGHANGSLQVWSLCSGDSTRPRPVELTIFE